MKTADRAFVRNSFISALATAAVLLIASQASLAKDPPVGVSFPPKLTNGQTLATDHVDDFLRATATLRTNVAVAKTAPTIDFAFYPGQDYLGNPWSNWGDSLAVGGKYYSSIGDHLAVGKGDGAHGSGTAFVYEYDPDKKSFRQLVDVAKVLKMPAGHYTPGKIHGRLDLGSDGWLYFSTHRGSPAVTSDQFHYEGDWILRCDPNSGKTEVVARGPVPKHCIPASVVDPERLIFYGGTAPGVGKDDAAGVHFFAYDLKQKKLLYSGANGPSRYLMLARSTGRVYYVPRDVDAFGRLMRYDPARGSSPEQIEASLGCRAATQETPQGVIYTVSNHSDGDGARLYAFNTKTEKVDDLGPAAVATSDYITSIDADASGRYLYYVPGAHGGSEKDGSPIVQFDTKTRKKKVIAFLHPYYKDKHGATLVGTFSTAIDPAGDKLYITWNVSRGGRGWDCCALTVVHIPESERPL